MTLKELKALSSDIEQAIADGEKARRADALKAADEAAKSFGFSLSELTKGSRSKAPATKSALPPKYRHPENPEVTWTGRGRRPGWISDGLASGRKLQDFAV
ncbi:H-NS histone family protein [Silicimonas algicola]|nr:H-NS histone family protein [Silicimonas algicola]AZQ69704.1 H-NS histone family protein [Silicimonas algicola]